MSVMDLLQEACGDDYTVNIEWNGTDWIGMLWHDELIMAKRTARAGGLLCRMMIDCIEEHKKKGGKG